MTKDSFASDVEFPLDCSTVCSAVALLDREKISAVELVEICRRTFETENPSVNALVVHDFEAARCAATQRDAERQAGRPLGTLHGVPFSVKESFDVAGWVTSCGDPRFRKNIAARDATIVSRLKAAGAILVGKSNVPIHLRDWQSYNELYGTTHNPRDLTRTPGGSSGGGAAAVCAGMSYFDVGSDIGSSLRNPAHYCGVFSHKSSHGLVPLTGHGINSTGVVPDMNVAGPIARSARDLERIFRAIAGPEGVERSAYRLDLPECPIRDLKDFRVGILLSAPIAEVDHEVANSIERLGHHLERENVSVAWNVRPDIELASLQRTYILMLRASTSGYLNDDEFHAALNIGGHRDATDDTYASLQFIGSTLHHRDWLLLQKKREHFAAAWENFFRDYDVLLCPAASTAAFPIAQDGEPWQRFLTVNGGPQPMTTQLFWAGHSGLCGLPSTMALADVTSSGLPVGVQIISKRFHDLTSLRFAQCLEDIGYNFKPPHRN